MSDVHERCVWCSLCLQCQRDLAEKQGCGDKWRPCAAWIRSAQMTPPTPVVKKVSKP